MIDRYILTPYFLDEPLPGLRALAQSGWALNQVDLPAGDLMARLASLHRPLAAFVADACARGERPVSIAGDCCAAIAVVAGLQRAEIDPTLFWFDAHGDFNTWETTPSGFLGGMPLAMMVGLGEQSLLASLDLDPIPASRVLLTDARDLDPGERHLVGSSDLSHFDTVARLLDAPLPAGSLYIHFDCDVVDPQEAPAMNYRAPGGPSASLLAQVFRRLAASGRIVAVSVSTWNPELDQDGRSRQVCMALVDALLSEAD